MSDRASSPPSAFASLRANGWVWLAALLAVAKLSLLRAQPIYAIGNAIHDDQLFLKLARSIAEGQWLGPFDNLTLAKGPVYPAFVALNHYLGLPLRFTEELVYVGACALAVRALRPLALAGWVRLLIFATLLLNPLTYEGQEMTRILRQHLTAPFALVVGASLIALTLRRDRNFVARLPWALLFGVTLGLFWITREEGIWILGMTALLAALAFGTILIGPTGARGTSFALLLAALGAGLLPPTTVAMLNRHYYGWFGTTEFHARDFRDAYGALVRVDVGPHYPYIAVSREAREAIYRVSPAFAELKPYFEGEIGRRWADGDRFRRDDRQIGAGWFMWALRDAVAAAGHYRSAGEVLAYYRRIADEVNRACDSGRLPARGPRSGFGPPWHPDYAHAIRVEGWQFIRTVFDFSAFEPNPPYSVGTDDEVRIFRDVTHERISPAPRATYIELPAQMRLDATKLDVLRWLGRHVGAWLSAFIILAHAAAVVRLIELVHARRFSWTFAFAVGAWGGGAGEIALNLLVHTTAFPNLYAAAYAPAFPLLLLFALLIAIDVTPDWRAPASRLWQRLRGLIARHERAAWAVGIGLIVFGARLHEVARHASDAPFLDQWKVEAEQILAPWLRGELGLTNFFLPHHEHVPLWTRLLVWIQAVVFGAWDPRLQMAINAAIHAAWIALLCDWLRRHLATFARLMATTLVLACACLPHAWENIVWGFQSQFPLALLCLFVFVRGAMTHAAGSRGWWWAQLAGFAGLFTVGSFWAAPLLVAATHFWMTPRQPRAWLAPLGLALVGAIFTLLAIRAQPAEGALALHAADARDFVAAWFYQLGWPVAAPAAALINLPLLVLALRLRASTAGSAFDRTMLVLGLCSVAQCAGIAYARGGVAADFVSRYSDLVAVGVIVNGVLLLRLAAAQRRWIAVAAAWFVAVGAGLHAVNTTGHAHYFHEHSAGRAGFRENAITAYVRQHNDKALTSEDGRALIYPDPAAVKRLLDEPRFAALLPGRLTLQSSFPSLGAVVTAGWPWWLALGAVLAASAFAARSAPADRLAIPDATAPLVPWIVFTIGAAGAFLLWPRPFTWSQQERWEHLVYPASAVRELRYEFISKSAYPNDRLDGAAELAPESLRNLFVGTRLDGADFTGSAQSQPFKLESPWLVIPFAGFPSAPGNSLALVIEDARGGTMATLRCEQAAPRDIGFWSVDVRQFAGRTARIVLTDGRAADQGWLAVAPPQPASAGTSGDKLAAAWSAERTVVGRVTAAAFFALGLAGVLTSLMSARRHA